MSSPSPSPLPLDSGSEAWVLTSAALVLFMVPALALFYGGMVGSKMVVSTMMLSFSALAVGSLFWSLVGYSLAFGPGGAHTLGGLSYGLFDSGDRLREGTAISEHAFFIFQLAFNAITLAVISGGVAGRMALLPWCAFCVLWTALVYCPLAHWIFYPAGWLAEWGVLDFAGGLVVETASGVSAFVLAYWLGPGKAATAEAPHAAHNVSLTLIGSGLLLVGWFGFNGGSALAAGYLAGRAMTNTHLAACSAAVVWSLCEAIAPPIGGGGGWLAGRPSALGAATGAVVGLVAVTPACGYISQMASVLLGVLVAPASFAAARALRRAGVDDRLECLPCHGVAGALGTLFVGLFAAQREGAPTDGLLYGGGAALLGKQAVALAVTVALCVAGTSVAFAALAAAARLARVSLRVADEDAPDASEHGEDAYTATFAAVAAAVTGGGGGGGGAHGAMQSPLLAAVEVGVNN